MKTQHFRYAALAAALMVAGEAGAAGFALYETSSRGVAMGGATMGQYNDASAVYANPALITDAEKPSLLFGTSLINPGMDIELQTAEGRKTYTPEDKWFPPPFAYYTHKLTDSLWFGFGLYTPFGLGVEHSNAWPGRFASVETEITTLNFNPNIAWKVNDKLSLALGLDILYFDITITRNIPVLDRLLDITADSVGFGANAALAYKITDDLGFGFVYRSEVREELEDTATVHGIPGSWGVWENLTLPQSVSFGLNYSGIEKWNFGLIATWTGWSSYDNLTLHFNPPLLGSVPEAGADKRWPNVWRFGAGAEYQFSEQSFVELGYVYDCDPINLDYADYLLPAGSRHILSAGLRTMISDNWEMGIAFAKILLQDEEVSARPAQGVYQTKFKNGDANVYSIQFSRSF